MTRTHEARPATLLALCLLCGSGVVACGSDGGEPAPAESEAQTLLELDHLGAQVRFLEMEPGIVLTTSTSQQGSYNPLSDPELRRLNTLEFYERLTGESPPQVLVDAHARGLALAEAEPFEDEGNVGEVTQELTGPEFQSEQCTGMRICAVDQTANREWGDYRVNWAHGWLNPVSGRVDLQLRHRRVRDWSNHARYPVDEGAVHFWNYNSPRPFVRYRLKVAVYEVQSGERYHFSMDHDDG